MGNSLLRKTLDSEIMKNSSGRIREAKKKFGSGSGYWSIPDFHGKLNSKPDLLSSLILFEHSFCIENAILFFLHFFLGKNAQNRPKNKQNWYLAKIGPNVNLVNVWTITLAIEFLFGQPKRHFWSQRLKILAKVTTKPQKMALLVPKSNF